jgi:hypothetical protein
LSLPLFLFLSLQPSTPFIFLFLYYISSLVLTSICSLYAHTSRSRILHFL